MTIDSMLISFLFVQERGSHMTSTDVITQILKDPRSCTGLNPRPTWKEAIASSDRLNAELNAVT